MRRAVILNPTYVKNIAKSYNYASFLCMLPFQWNYKTKRLERVQCKKRLNIFYGNVAICFAYYAFVIGRYFHILQSEDTKKAKEIYMTFIAALYTVLPCNHIVIIWKSTGLLGFSRSSIALAGIIDTYIIQPQRRTPLVLWILNTQMQLVFNGLNSIAFLMVVYIFLNPKSPELIFSVMPDSVWGLNIVFMCFSSFIQAIISANFVVSCIFLINTGSSVTLQAIFIVAELNQNMCRATINSLRSTKEVVQKYLALQLIMSIGNDTYGFVFAYNKTLVMSIIIYSTYGAIKFKGLVSILLGCCGVFGFVWLITLFTFLSEYNSRLQDLVDSWRYDIRTDMNGNVLRMCRDNQNSIYWKGMPVIKLNMMGMYSIDRPLVLTICNIILESLADLLMLN